ncbi:MAG: hypothetical protein M1827_001018 [Pycnora praestabilis]|nr:MAG: hypothetical protein M1827_001018 [Pycnora praestabilis]
MVAERLGQNKALDDAVRCITVNHVGRLSKNEVAIRRSRGAYLEALRSLQIGLYDPETGTSSETLCATWLLGLYEVFSSTDRDSWIKHAGGASRLMQIRGTQRHENEFDAAMFHAFRVTIIVEALICDRDCFLDSPEWRAVAPLGLYEGSSDIIALSNRLYNDMAMLPGLIGATQSAKSAQRATGLTGEAAHNVLVVRTLRLSLDLESWYEDFISLYVPHQEKPPIEEVPSKFDDPLFPIVYQYEDSVTLGAILCYYASQILVNELLDNLQNNDAHRVKDSDLVNKICRSVEPAAKENFIGPYTLLFPLNVALRIATPEIRRWIRTWMNRIGDKLELAKFDLSESEEPRVVVENYEDGSVSSR